MVFVRQDTHFHHLAATTLLFVIPASPVVAVPPRNTIPVMLAIVPERIVCTLHTVEEEAVFKQALLTREAGVRYTTAILALDTMLAQMGTV
jgi:hypothetical protein